LPAVKNDYYGFTEKSLNQHEARAGEWTRAGLNVSRKFLSECLGIKWITGCVTNSSQPVIRRDEQLTSITRGAVRRSESSKGPVTYLSVKTRKNVRRVVPSQASVSESSTRRGVHSRKVSSSPEGVHRDHPEERSTPKSQWESHSKPIECRIFRQSLSLDPVRLCAQFSTYHNLNPNTRRDTLRRAHSWLHRRDVGAQGGRM